MRGFNVGNLGGRVANGDWGAIVSLLLIIAAFVALFWLVPWYARQ